MKKNSIYKMARYAALLCMGLIFYGQMMAQIQVSGKIDMGPNATANGFPVLISGTETKLLYADALGNYSTTLQAGGSYEVKPLDCSHNPLNGLSTFDLVLISQHFSGVNPLDNPYKIIAADVNNDGIVSLADSIVLRNLILGIFLELPEGNWRFVPSSYVFPDPGNPFNPPYPQSVFISNLQMPEVHNFVAIKVGDINGSSLLDPIECGNISLPYSITGRVSRDETPDCQYNTGEQLLSGWKVEASNSTGTFYGTTNVSGEYTINVLPGTYEVRLIHPNELWGGGCDDTVSNVVVTNTIFPVVDFSVRAQVDCPHLTVELSSFILRRCFSSAYKVQYCNLGTVAAEDARVEVELDEFFDFQTSSVPYTHLGGQKYSFEVGDIPSGQCNSFSIYFTVSCNAALGQTHCTEAKIYPDTVCTSESLYEGPSLQVSGQCNGDFVNFTVSNIGTDMTTSTNYIVVEDIIIMAPPPPQIITLPQDGSEVLTFPANGKTYRLEVEQPQGHPWSTFASATVEGCGTNANGSFSTGMVNLFPMSDQEPSEDIDCMENVGSYDPNDKQGFPLGVLSQHFVPLEQPIEYLIRFQNTGTDTAFTVIVKDTLDAQLDPASIRVMGASHPYTFNLSGPGLAQFVFTNIMLPDSNVNEAASHGFVKFLVSPKGGLAEGSVVKNNAEIYFDFNEPVVTNTTWHTYGEQYLSTNTVFVPNVGLDVFPNPAKDQVRFLLKSPHTITGELLVFELGGRLAARQVFEHNNFTFDARNLQSGCYLYKIASGNQILAAGKMIKVE